MAFFLILLSLYTDSVYRIILGLIWLVIGLNNAYNNAVLEVTETTISIRNSLGIITKRYAYREGDISIRKQEIYFNKERIYKHLFTFSQADFEQVSAYLTSENPELNLGRHLVADDDSEDL
ncbi:hypothetical protein [Aureispira anguillae]|nr:hypothetical protein [Aureispira anguillae]